MGIAVQFLEGDSSNDSDSMSVSTPTETPSDSGALAKATTPPEVLAAVQEILRQFPVVEKNVRLFPLENRVVKDSMNSLVRAFGEYFKLRWEPLRLRINESDITFEDESVYHDPDKGNSLSFRMYKDGLKEIRFLTDLEIDDLVAFLETFREVLTVDQDEDDFVTLLWQKDLDQVQFFALDDFLSSSSGETSDIPAPISIQRDLGSTPGRRSSEEASEEMQELIERASSTGADGRAVFELDESELVRVQELIDAESAADPFDDFVEVVLEIVRADDDPARLGKTMGIVRNLIISLAERDDFDRAASILDQLRHAKSLSGPDGGLMDQTVEAIAQDDLLKKIAIHLTETEAMENDAGIYRFLRQLPGSKVGWLCDWLALPQHTREITSILSAMPNPDRDMFVEKLQDPDGRIAKAMIVLLGRIDPKAAFEDIAQVTEHADPEVREMASMVISKSNESKFARQMIAPLSDKRRSTQRYGLEYFRINPNARAFPVIQGLIETQGGKQEDPKWLLLLMQSLLACSAESALDYFESTVFKRSILDKFMKSRDSGHLRLAALYALGKSEDPKTISFLEKLAKSFDKDLRSKAVFQLKSRGKREDTHDKDR